MASAMKPGDRKRALGRPEQLRNILERVPRPTSHTLAGRGNDPTVVVGNIDKRLEPLLLQLLGCVAGLRDVVQSLARRVHHIEQQLGQRDLNVTPSTSNKSPQPPDVVTASSGD